MFNCKRLQWKKHPMHYVPTEKNTHNMLKELGCTCKVFCLQRKPCSGNFEIMMGGLFATVKAKVT